MDLTFKASCAELNELQLTFNKVAKMIKITNKTVNKGYELRALLDYSEAYFVFKEFQDGHQVGICLSNMGAIRFSIFQYEKANLSFSRAVS